MDDAFEVGALRAIPVDEMNLSRAMDERTIVPLIRNERTLRTLIGNKRSYDHGKTTTTTPNITTSRSKTTRKRRFVQPFVAGEDRETTTTASFDLSDSIKSLGCVAYENVIAKKNRGDKDDIVAYLPPYEYCSASMFNQVKSFSSSSSSQQQSSSNKTTTGISHQHHHHHYHNHRDAGGSFCGDLVSDRGGTIKSVLQSSKSFVHVLTTHPLKNTFRAYIQIRPYLSFDEIGMPRHRVVRIFSLNIARDEVALIRRPERCDSCRNRLAKQQRGRCRRCPFWPDESFAFYFETTQNFGMFLKRDPCIHNGSVVAVKRVYVTDSSSEHALHREAIYVSSFSLKNLNADFDGDTITVMIARGIESTTELNECLTEPFLYGGSSTPRFSFCQSLTHRIFRLLCYGGKTTDFHAKYCRSRCCDDDDDTASEHPATTIKRKLLRRLNVWNNPAAAKRARRVMGPFYTYYERVLRDVAFAEFVNDRDDNWWTIAIWSKPVLDMVHALSLRDGRDDMLNWTIAKAASAALPNRRGSDDDDDGGDDRAIVLDDEPMCVENWLIVHSGAKASPFELWNLESRFRTVVDRRRRCCDVDVVDNTLTEKNFQTNVTYGDFFAECSNERANEYSRYLNDFVTVSKSVPKSSYFASGLKWVAQKCTVRRDCLTMNNVPLLNDLSYFLRDIDSIGDDGDNDNNGFDE